MKRKGLDLPSLLSCLEREEKSYQQSYKDFDFVRWHPVSVGVIPKGGSKAKGLEKIIEKVNFPPERVYPFGDGRNNKEMLS